MWSLIAFTAPWLFVFLAVLPVIWWLLRLTPPPPRKVIFPALALLRDLPLPRQLPAKTPWWLLALRLLIAATLIVAFAGPILDPVAAGSGKRPLLIAVDNDWAAARDWPARQTILNDLIAEAQRDHQPVSLLTTAPAADGAAPRLGASLDAGAALAQVNHLTPQPWNASWGEAAALLDQSGLDSGMDVVWLADGTGNPEAQSFYAVLQKHGAVRVLTTAAPLYTLGLTQADDGGEALTVRRTAPDAAAEVMVTAVGADGTVLSRRPARFAAGAPEVSLPLDDPAVLRNQIARFTLARQTTAAATLLLDSGWQRRPVGIVGDQAELDQHSLLNGLYYIDRALAPSADLHIDRLDKLLQQDMAVIVLPDSASLSDGDAPALSDWVKRGGVLLRFASEGLTGEGPRATALLPVTLRGGDRALGGSLSWAEPQKLAPFPASSPFHDLPMPPDVTVTRQVLAEPSPDLQQETWAALADGTPLVTGRAIGKGVSVLVHVTAGTDWSNLPLSGLFVGLLRRVVDLAQGLPAQAAHRQAATLPPWQLLDGFGEPRMPAASAQPLKPDDDLANIQPGPLHPPGLYGDDAYNQAFNLGTALGPVAALANVPTELWQPPERQNALQPLLLALAFILLLVDLLASLSLRDVRVRARLPARVKTGMIAVFLFSLLLPQPVSAADDKTAVELTGKTYLAYIKTGDRETDATAAAGLNGLAQILQRRTAIDPVAVTGIDADSDDLAFFPLLYWPLTASAAPLTPAGAAHVNDYLHHGGMILFDANTGEEASPALVRHLLAGVDLPALSPLPRDHVLKRSFYLLDEFPGRYASDVFWLQTGNAGQHDGVATVLYGANGWAAAWAADAGGRPLYACIPGGEVQREQAFRFGVNLVMYALTGNYKSDQLQATELLKKFGQ